MTVQRSNRYPSIILILTLMLFYSVLKPSITTKSSVVSIKKDLKCSNMKNEFLSSKNKPHASDYIVTLVDENSKRSSFLCNEEDYITDAAAENDIEMNVSCGAGVCMACLGQVLEGELDQVEQSVLTKVQLDNGYCLPCVARPLSNVTLRSNIPSSELTVIKKQK